jgi:hypothetical protein
MVNTALLRLSCPIVDDEARACVAAQKLPKPWVGKIRAVPGSSRASRRADEC